jgi:hypothetical protein
MDLKKELATSKNQMDLSMMESGDRIRSMEKVLTNGLRFTMVI